MIHKVGRWHSFVARKVFALVTIRWCLWRSGGVKTRGGGVLFVRWLMWLSGVIRHHIVPKNKVSKHGVQFKWSLSMFLCDTRPTCGTMWWYTSGVLYSNIIDQVRSELFCVFNVNSIKKNIAFDFWIMLQSEFWIYSTKEVPIKTLWLVF